MHKTKILKEIETLTSAYADKCDALRERLQWLKDEQEDVRRTHIKGIIAASRVAKSARAKLKIYLGEHPGLFTKPRTQVFSGVKVGYKKNKGKLIFPDNIIKLIKRKLPDDVEALIKVAEKPIASALSNMSAVELKKIGVTVTNCTDEIVITNVDSAVEKMVQEIMKDEQYDENEN